MTNFRNIFTSIKSKNTIWYLVILVFSLPTITNLIKTGYFPMDDDMQAMRIYQMDKCIEDGQIPCRWVPDMGYRYGYPQFNYYAPLPYYVMEATHLIGLNILDAVKLGFALALLLGNLTMFALGEALWGRWAGLVMSLLYAYTPYRASDLFVRGAMGESWAFIFMPLILLSILNTIKQPKIKSISLLALSTAGLILSHNITTLMFLPLAGIWGLTSLVLSSKSKRQKYIIFRSLTIGGLWAIAIAAFFFLPVIFEKKYAHTETLLSGYFNYLAHFVTIKQLFFTSFWGYGSSQLGPTDDLSFFISPLLLLLGILSSVFSFFYLTKRRFGGKPIVALISIILAIFTLFMTHVRSTPIWKITPFLEYLQFPWRFLSPANFFLILGAGFFITLFNPVFRSRLSFILIAIIFLFNVSFFRPQTWFYISPTEKFSGYSWDKQLTISIYDYLPIFATEPPVNPAPRLPYSPNNNIGILNYQKKSDSISFTVRSKSNKPITVFLPQYDFPGWKLSLDKKTISHRHDNRLGLITFELPQGTHTIYAKLTNTPIRTLGNLLSLIFTPPAFYFYFFKSKLKDKHL